MIQFYKILFVILYFLHSTNGAKEKKLTYYQKFTDIECMSYTNILKDIKCYIKHYNKFSTALFAEAIVAGVVNDKNENDKILVHTQLWRLIGTKWKPWAIDRRIYFCELMSYLNKRGINALLDLILPILKKSSINHSCPYGPNEKIYGNNISLDDLPTLPKLLLPIGTYKLHIEYHHEGKKKKLGDFICYFELGNDHTLNRKNKSKKNEKN